ncbi:MAG: hypothetical protein ACI8Z5_001659 [Lentimonas sp.]|jgi:hypothetical protein
MNESTEKRLEVLLSKQFGEGLDHVEAKELNCLLASSESARKCYLRHCQLHSTLLEERDLLESILAKSSEDNVVPMFEPDDAGSETNKSHLPLLITIGSLAAVFAVSFFSFISPSPEKTRVQQQAHATQTTPRATQTDGDLLEQYERTVAALPATGSLSRPAATVSANKDATIRFNRDVRPILSDNCFHCHGPDKNTREADLRLDTHEGILTELSDGRRTIIPGDPENSEFYKRIITTETDMIMPPLNSHKHLKAEHIQLFRDWIAQGAEWEDHWSFTQIERPAVPTVIHSEKVTNPIDAFILRKVERNGLTPNEEADGHTLVRRVSFDTRGLPPTTEEIIAFVSDESPDAYEQMVDRFIADQQFGEHRARYWLDAARYSDTHGYHIDNYRSIWPYRDWVINAFNDNMSFDQFTIDQIAGDMLPEPTQSQRVATGFNRCNPTTSEGGAIDDEYFAIYAQDRVEATSTVWLGLTMACASCHDHKFDPLSQKEFYQMTAFFRNTTQAAMDGNVQNTPPAIHAYIDEHLVETAQLEPIVNRTNQELLPIIGHYVAANPDSREPFEWIAEDSLELRTATEETGILIDQSTSNDLGDQTHLKVGTPFSLSFWVLVPEKDSRDKPLTLFGRYDPDTKNQGWLVKLEKNATITMQLVTDNEKPDTVKFTSMPKLKPGSWNHVLIAYDGTTSGGQQAVNYGAAFSMRINNAKAPKKGIGRRTKFRGLIGTDKPFVIGSAKPAKEAGSQKINIKDLRIFNTVLCQPEQELLALTIPSEHIKPSKPAKEADAVFTLDIESTTQRMREASTALSRLKELQVATPMTLVMQEKKDSEPFAHILARGDYASPGERVIAGVPEVFPPLAEDATPNRLALAYWLVNPENPLPARVNTNRFWQELFGTGIVKTSEDFGSQGEPPSHIELLDWLAAEFIESNWDMKHMYKLMLMSSTYRQSTTISPEELQADPENRLLARGARYRLDAEVIRDQALFVSDLIVEKIGGQPVKPYQPDGVWKAVAYSNSNTAKFNADTGDKLYRRSLYTLWKRTAAPPSMAIFDAPTRESCSVRRERTNTPLQALVLMNDPQFVEAARHLASVIITDEREDKFAALYARAMGAEPSEQVIQILKNTYDQVLPTYIENPAAANELLSIGDSPVDASIDPVQLATWTIVANQVMNLDSFISKN